MDLTPYRPQFSIHFLTSLANDQFRLVKDSLREKGHTVYSSIDEKAFKADFKRKPTHLVIFEISQITTIFEDFIADCIDIAPHSNFIAIGLSSYRPSIKKFRENGVIDYIDSNEDLISLLDWSIDNALERVILKIQNKTLVKETQDQELINKNLQAEIDRQIQVTNQLKIELSEEEDLSNVILNYENAKSREDLIQNFFVSLEEYLLDGSKILFFKYLEPINLLVASHCSGIPIDHIKGAGIKLSAEEAREPKNFLMRPSGFDSLSILMKDVFGVGQYHLKTLMVNDDIDGVFVFFGENLFQINSIRFNNKFAIFKLAYEKFAFFRKLNELEIDDTLNNFYSLEEFEMILNDQLENIQKSRSTLTLVRLSIDNLSHLEENQGPSAAESTMKYAIAVTRKLIRSSDRIYRTAVNEFTLVLPHTKVNDATVVCEKIRRFILDKATLSFGISSYPTLAHSTEQLLKSSLQALSAIMSRGGNKVGVARLISNGKTDKGSDFTRGSNA